jgi:hypothetical protein
MGGANRMSDLIIRCLWKTERPLHLGTGIARAGYADRIIQLVHGKPRIRGEAVKGAIRGAAERLSRWLDYKQGPEDADGSAPTHPVLSRIFAGLEEGPCKCLYRFHPAQYEGKKDEPFLFASTAINSFTGTAREETLRVIEAWPREALFRFEISGSGGNWHSAEQRDYWDAMFIVAAILCTGQVGGKRGAGFGTVRCQQLTILVDGQPCFDSAQLAQEHTVERLALHLKKRGESAA